MQPADSPPLTSKQTRFVEEYLVDLNATKAAIRAGYSAKTAQPQSSRMLADPRMAQAIADAPGTRSSRTGITADHVLKGLARIAFGDIRKLFAAGGTLKPITELDDDTAGALAGIDIDTSTERGRDGEASVTTRTSKVRMTDKIRALELLGRHLGMFTEKVEHTGTVRFVIER